MCPQADDPTVPVPYGSVHDSAEAALNDAAANEAVLADPVATGVGSKRPRRAKSGKVTIVGVLGELLITAGALVLLFLGWQVWWNDMIMANSQSSAASQISQDWISQDRITQDTSSPEPLPTVDQTEPSAAPAPVDYGVPVVGVVPANATAFAVLYVPRFGADYHRSIAEGTGHDVLNSNRLGIGHYSGTQMPGEIGNFAVAAHRSAFGGGMHLINELQLGDAIYVQTADGYYTYRYRDTEYVAPSQVQVVASVPNNPDGTAVDRIITLTSCNPLYSTAERIIAYGVLESWQPLAAGAPAELAPIIAAQG
ncbi:MAG: class E sortase [Cryobacterium sp.]|uniref:class E sortase n=1 Tax=unclassified Cryobacterium TaxID=2649013 RepID=UPI001A21EE74|nr:MULTISPECIES: class E sortase [unclassified Cryobacterium]MCY7403904.1 class E sortase [Cryobacterium sp.]MEC5153710.1 sortase A [Cryobacterium sp. CAN_C3]